MGVRPEKLRLAAAETAAPAGNVLRGHVTDASYLGVMTQYVVHADGADLTVVAQNTGGGLETLGPGREVVVSWEPHAHVRRRQGGRSCRSRLSRWTASSSACSTATTTPGASSCAGSAPWAP